MDKITQKFSSSKKKHQKTVVKKKRKKTRAVSFPWDGHRRRRVAGKLWFGCEGHRLIERRRRLEHWTREVLRSFGTAGVPGNVSSKWGRKVMTLGEDVLFFIIIVYIIFHYVLIFMSSFFFCHVYVSYVHLPILALCTIRSIIRENRNTVVEKLPSTCHHILLQL